MFCMSQGSQSKTAVADLMIERGLARHDLMAEFGVTEMTVRRWQVGQRMSVARLQELADYFGVTTDEVLAREREAA